MHLKNFSLMHSDDEILLTPAYDLLNVNLIYPKDREDLALTLGGRKSKIKRSDFDQFAMSLGLSDVVRDNLFKEFSKQTKKVAELIDRSFLPDDYKVQYLQIFDNKLKQIGI